jgi:FlgD Ig-like domain
MRSRTPALGLAVVLASFFLGDANASAIRTVETPLPSTGSGEFSNEAVRAAAPADYLRIAAPKPNPNAPPLLAPAIDCFTYDTNFALVGGRLVPPDPHCAVGPDHVIVIGNVTVEWRPKSGIANLPQYQSSLKVLFTGLAGTLGTNCFDPKVIYDQYSSRFIVVVLERTDAPTNSRILLAVSKTSNPNNGWWLHSIDSKMNIGGLDRWADYPGIGVDDKAIYITANMFSFGAAPAFGGVRLWIVNKSPTYDGPNNNIAVTAYNPYTAAGSVEATTQPAHMFGPPGVGSGARPLGTFLVSYSGLADIDGNDFIQIIELTDPLNTVGGPFFTAQFIGFGNIDSGAALPDAPQLGSAYAIETNDRRALNAAWRQDQLFMCAEMLPSAGPDAAQTTAHWWRVDTSTVIPGLVLADHGNAGAEDLGGGTHTFYPSVMVDCDLNMAIGFSASNSGIYCGAYYTTRLFGDPAGTVSPTGTLQAGLAPYKRFHSGTRNRWGDYSGLALCPNGEADFYVFNEYAGTTGTPGTGSQGAEDGRWFTKLGWFRLKEPVPVNDTPAGGTRLAQNIPNPFNPSTTIRFSLSARERATVSVYDARGQLVRTLLDETRAAGDHDAHWDGRDANGKSVSSGVYFYRLTAGSVIESKKMVLLK